MLPNVVLANVAGKKLLEQMFDQNVVGANFLEQS
jgi:hypothetical protein